MLQHIPFKDEGDYIIQSVYVLTDNTVLVKKSKVNTKVNIRNA